jgi:hypothetical protein
MHRSKQISHEIQLNFYFYTSYFIYLFMKMYCISVFLKKSLSLIYSQTKSFFQIFNVYHLIFLRVIIF